MLSCAFSEEQEVLNAQQAFVEGDLEVVEVNHDNDNLWVDRYAPRKYTELLSDEVNFSEWHRLIRTES